MNTLTLFFFILISSTFVNCKKAPIYKSKRPSVRYSKSSGYDYPKNYIIVLKRDKFINNILGQVATTFSREYHFQPNFTFSLGDFGGYVIEEKVVEKYLYLIQELDAVAYIEEDAEIQAYFYTTTSSPSVSCIEQKSGEELWGLSRISRHSAPGSFSGSSYRYSKVDSGKGVTIYVVDSGVNTDHQDFGNRAVHGFTAKLLNAFEGSADLNGHGTHVAGVAAGAKHGVAKEANIVAVKVLNSEGGGSVGNLIEGITWMVDDFKKKKANNKKAKAVANLSLGLTASGSSITLENCLKEAVRQGIPVAVAAGNVHADACKWSPARMKEVLTVGASDMSDRIAQFSNFGECVNILAPGEKIKSTYHKSDTSTKLLQGTSMASPFVSGVMARYISYHEENIQPENVYLWVLNVSSKNTLDLKYGYIQDRTPNKILYMGCGGDLSASSSSGIKASFPYIIFSFILFYNVVRLA